MRLLRSLANDSSPSMRFEPIILMLGASSCLSIGLGMVRMIYSGHSVLLWLTGNLFLAWIPLFFAWMARRTFEEPPAELSKERSRRVTLYVVGWLIFFPNAPYLITDFVHLHQRAGVSIYFDIMLFMSFAWTGLLLGILSLRILHEIVVRKLDEIAGAWFVLSALALCSFGVYMGRIGRWNSWDVVAHPIALTSWCLSRFLPENWVETAGFCGSGFLFMTAVYATMMCFFRSNNIADYRRF